MRYTFERSTDENMERLMDELTQDRLKLHYRVLNLTNLVNLIDHFLKSENITDKQKVDVIAIMIQSGDLMIEKIF